MATLTQTVAPSVLDIWPRVFTPNISDHLALKRKREEEEHRDEAEDERFTGFNKRQKRPGDVFLPRPLPGSCKILPPLTAQRKASNHEEMLRQQLCAPSCCLSSSFDIVEEHTEPESSFFERQTLRTKIDSCLVSSQTEFEPSFDEAQAVIEGSWLDWEWPGEDEANASLSDDKPLFPGVLSREEEMAAERQLFQQKYDDFDNEEDEGYDSADNDVKPPRGLGKSAPGRTLLEYYLTPVRQQEDCGEGFVKDEDEDEDEIEEEEDEEVDHEGDDENNEEDNGDADEEDSSDTDSTSDFDLDYNSSESEDEEK